MTNMATWATRVEKWRASGLTSAAFCAGSSFSAGGLRNAAHLLDKRERAEAKAARVPLARVVRASPAPAMEAASATPEPGARAVIEVGRVRVAVAPGADRATLATVLELLTAEAR